MATDYPGALDNFSILYDNDDYIRVLEINTMQDAIEALEAKVGVDSSAVDTTVDYKVKNFWNASSPNTVYFFNDTAPLRWATTALPADVILGLKGGALDYDTTGGQEVGIWTIDTAPTDEHNHLWAKTGAPQPIDTFDYFGNDLNVSGANFTSKGTGCVLYVSSGDPRVMQQTACYTDNDTHDHDHDGDWRPTAALGILAFYEG